MITPFSIQIEGLTSLGPDLAVEFFRGLLWNEASRVGVARQLIDVPQCINVGDGGIDACITKAKPKKQSLIPAGNSGFQIKSGDLGSSKCKKELHEKGDFSRPLKSELLRLLKKNGTYNLVLFADLTSEKRLSRSEAIKEELRKNGFPSAKVNVYTANQIAGIAERFPSLVALINQRIECLPYKLWAEKGDICFPKAFVPDEERKNIINNIRSLLRKPNEQSKIFRIIGLPGIGKSRLTFETLSPDDLGNRVIYFNSADNFLNSAIYYEIQRNKDLSVIIVIDECSSTHHDVIVRAFSANGPNLAIITLSHDIEKIPPPTFYHKLSQLSEKNIEKIIKSESAEIPGNVVNRLSKFADGYPRVAILLLQSYLRGSTTAEDFVEISDENLMNRLIGGNIDLSSEHFKNTKRVLTGLSLFKKIGIKGVLEKEIRWIANYIGIEWNRFIEIVQEQKKRGILQGEYYLYVTPFILRLYLIKEWWESRGYEEEIFINLFNSIPQEFRGDLFKRLIEHIPYIHATSKGREFAKKILGDTGIFADGSLLESELGADFFLKLTEADPKAALNRLKKTIWTWPKERLLKFTTGRRQVVWALEKIVMWKDLFQDGARVLLALGEAENETWSNNASGVFIEIFSPGPGQVAPTEASPKERFPILEEAFKSNLKGIRQLAIKACNKALESQHFVRTVGDENQGLRLEPNLWMPKTYGELFDSYKKVWNFLNDNIINFDDDEKKQVVETLLDRSLNLSQIQNLAEMIISSIEKLTEYNFIDKKQVLTGVIRFLRYADFPFDKNIRSRWEELKDKLTGKSFSSLLTRYVGMDIFEDRYDPKGKQQEIVKSKIRYLAKKAKYEPHLLEAELKWLVTQEAKNVYFFGYELGKIDIKFSLLPSLLNAQKKSKVKHGVLFLGGYFKALFERDKIKWEFHLDTLSKNSDMNILVPEITWRSGYTDKAAQRILDLAEERLINWQQFRLFIFGGYIYKLPRKIFRKWIQFLLKSNELQSIHTALELFEFYYIHEETKVELPIDLTKKLLLHPTLFTKRKGLKRDTMVEHAWVDIGKKFIKQYPEEAIILAKKMLSHFGEEGTIVGGFHSLTEDVLNNIAQLYPLEIWEIATSLLGPPIDSRSWHIKDWIQRSNLFSIISFSDIWKWVDVDIDKRAKFLSNFAPKQISSLKEGRNITRELLVRYGDRKDVRSSLRANFFTEFWGGPASSHYLSKKEKLIDLRKNEKNENIIIWIDETISEIDIMVLKSKIEEEKEDFNN